MCVSSACSVVRLRASSSADGALNQSSLCTPEPQTLALNQSMLPRDPHRRPHQLRGGLHPPLGLAPSPGSGRQAPHHKAWHMRCFGVPYEDMLCDTLSSFGTRKAAPSHLLLPGSPQYIPTCLRWRLPLALAGKRPSCVVCRSDLGDCSVVFYPNEDEDAACGNLSSFGA